MARRQRRARRARERALTRSLGAGALLAAAGGAALAARRLAGARGAVGEPAGAGAGRKRVRRGRPLAVELRALALARAAGASARLAEGERQQARLAAHKQLKKLRATLRLAAGVDRRGRSALREARRVADDAARLLSGERDALATLALLEQRFAGGPAEARWRAWRAALRTPRAGAGESDRDVSAARASIARAQAAIRAWQPSRRDGVSAARERLVRSYGAGRHAMRRAYDDTRPERIEQWRKRVEELDCQLRLLRDVLSAPEGVSAARARELAALLGEHHDLEALRLDARARPALAEREALELLIVRRQAELRIRALVTGGLLYAATPRAFARELKVARGRRRRE